MTSATHKEFLKRSAFLKDFKLKGLGEDEFTIVDRYGFWFSALEEGAILPVTDEQSRFLSVCRNECEAQSNYEKAWMAYKAIIYLDRLLMEEIIDPIMKGNIDVISKIKKIDIPEFAIDNIVIRLRDEEGREMTSEKRLILQDAVIKIRDITRKGSVNRYSHTNYGGLHGFGL